MAIKYFIFITFIISLFTLFIGVGTKQKIQESEEKPIMIFDNSVLFTINSQEIQRIVDSKKTLIYKKKEESFDSKVVFKTTENNIYDTLISDYTLKVGNKISFLGNVVFERSDFMKLTSEEVFYDLSKKIAHNTKDFVASYYNNKLTGNSFYTKDIYYMKSKDVTFEIELKD
ncbi:MAG: hypothetical protein M0P43_09045 [Arcobacteraceae bacterium]|nr:hypothetical protein [Arcobacteraceae bacterium]MDY0328763.1 hypothetical protein [Arcobacteraceae bacterium]